MNLPAAELRGILNFKTNLFADRIVFCILSLFLGLSHICLLYLRYQTYLPYWQRIHQTRIQNPITLLLLLDVLQISFWQWYSLLFLMIWVTLYLGTFCMRKWTWSLSIPIFGKFISYLLDISGHTSFSVSSTSLSKITFLYFAGQTKWYRSTDTLCDLWIYLLKSL